MGVAIQNQSRASQITMASKADTVSPLDSELDQLTLTFTQCQDAPVQMSSAMAILINGKVYYGGGVPEVDDFGDTDIDTDDTDDDERMVDNKYYVQCLELSKNKWSTLPKLPMELFGLGEVKGHLVTVGGEIETGVDGDSDADSTYHASTNELYTVLCTEKFPNSLRTFTKRTFANTSRSEAS